jgi:hypothetical protein
METTDMKYFLMALLVFTLPPAGLEMVPGGYITQLDFECTAEVVGSVETYLKVYYDHEDPANPGQRYVTEGPVDVWTNEQITVAAEWQPVAIEWYYKPVGELGEAGTLITPEPPPEIVEGDYVLGHVCGTVPDSIYVELPELGEDDIGERFNGPHVVPGIVEAEDYDVGAYLDLSLGNDGDSTYREGDDVDLKTWADGAVVGFIQNSEWLEYTVTSALTGAFDISLRVRATNDAARFRVWIDGVDVSGEMIVPKTADDWEADEFELVTVPSVTLTAGWHVVRIVSEVGPYDFDSIEVQPIECDAIVDGSVELYARAYYLHEDPAAPGTRFEYTSAVKIATDENVEVEDGSPVGVEWYYRPFGIVHTGEPGDNQGEFLLGYTCGTIPDLIIN